MHVRTLAAGLAVAATLLGQGCARYRVQSDYDPEAGFSQLNTYAWIDSTAAARESERSPFLERRVRRAVDKVLQDRGIEPAGDEPPDFLVTAFVVEPSQASTSWRRWYAGPCPPRVSFHIGFAYPYGFSVRRPWHRIWGRYVRDPWGYACAYRIGFGYIWIPVYEQPGDRLPGTLVVDVLRPSNRELIWRGWAEGALNGRLGREVSQDELDEIVARVLAEFPPR